MLDDRLPGIAREAARDRGLAGDGAARRAGTSPTTRSTPHCRTSTATSAGTTRTGARTSTRSRSCSSATCGRGCACSRSARRRRGRAAPRPARRASTSATDILDDPSDRARPRRVLRGARRPVRARAGRRRAPAVRLAAPSTSRTASRRSTMRSTWRDGARDGARHAARRLGLRAERGHAGARRAAATSPTRPRRRGSGSTSTCTRSRRTSGRSRAPGLVVRRVEQAEGYDELRQRQDRRAAAAAAGRRPQRVDVLLRRPATATRGVSVYARKGREPRLAAMSVYADVCPLPRAVREPLPARPPARATRARSSASRGRSRTRCC